LSASVCRRSAKVGVGVSPATPCSRAAPSPIRPPTTTATTAVPMLHGLRGTAVTRRPHPNCTAPEIASIIGRSMKTIQNILDAHYLGRAGGCRIRDQEAERGVRMTNRHHKPDDKPVDPRRRNERNRCGDWMVADAVQRNRSLWQRKSDIREKYREDEELGPKSRCDGRKTQHPRRFLDLFPSKD
jgi:hypothetical protein